MTIKRRDMLAGLGLGVAGAVMAGRPGHRPNLHLRPIPGARPRNVVFILSDDHRYDFMGFLGKPAFLRTPNMDRLATEGAHIQNTFVQTALCSPSRASILTGQISNRHGVVNNQSPESPDLVFFPQYLQQAGYHTAFIGKWHMGEDEASDKPRPGFDHWVSFKGQGVYFDPELNIDGQTTQVPGYITDILTDHALQWLQQQDARQPFFLYLSHKAPHNNNDLTGGPKYDGVYAEAPVEYPPTMANTEANYKGKPAWVRAQRNSWHGVDYAYYGGMSFETLYRKYCESLLGIDESIGRVMDQLERMGLADSTMVIYMGDNGFCLGEHGLIDKRHMYEESARVPLVMRCPELIAPGTRVTPLVQNIDIAETILETAGLEPPDTMDGLSFLPLLRGKAMPWRDRLYYQYFWEWNFPQTPTVLGLRTDQYAYMHYLGVWDIDELYDMSDPMETTNLIEAPEHQERIVQFRHDIYDWLGHNGGLRIPLSEPSGVRRADHGP